jgi:hypothetical protein
VLKPPNKIIVASVGCITCCGAVVNVNVLFESVEGKGPLLMHNCVWEHGLKINFRKLECGLESSQSAWIVLEV